jgi:hypothetical protein
MQRDDGKCQGIHEQYCFGACELKEEATDYNYRVMEAIASLQAQPSFALLTGD